MANLNTSVRLKQKTLPESELVKQMEDTAKQMKSKLVEVFIPDAYRAGFGDPVSFSVNGVRLEVPIGKRIKVPEPHAKHINRLMKGTVLTKQQNTLSPEEVYED